MSYNRNKDRKRRLRGRRLQDAMEISRTFWRSHDALLDASVELNAVEEGDPGWYAKYRAVTLAWDKRAAAERSLREAYLKLGFSHG